MRIGLTGLLFLIFLTLKLTGVIAWSWWWVTAPLWIGALLAVVMMIIGILIAGWAHNKHLNQINRRF